MRRVSTPDDELIAISGWTDDDVAVLYAAAVLEELALIELVERLNELNQNKMLSIGAGQASNLLHDFWDKSYKRMPPKRRAALFAGLFGSQVGAPNGGSPVGESNSGSQVGAPNGGSPVGEANSGSPVGEPNSASPIGAPNGGSPVGESNSGSQVGAPNGGSPAGEPNSGSPTAEAASGAEAGDAFADRFDALVRALAEGPSEAVAQAAAALHDDLAAHTGDDTAKAAAELRGTLGEIARVLSDMELLSAYRAEDMWQLVERVQEEFDGGADVRQVRARAISGARILRGLPELGGGSDVAEELVAAARRWLPASSPAA
jgi:hypothetical protein